MGLFFGPQQPLNPPPPHKLLGMTGSGKYRREGPVQLHRIFHMWKENVVLPK